MILNRLHQKHSLPPRRSDGCYFYQPSDAGWPFALLRSETWLWSGDSVIYCFSNFMISLAVDLKMWLLFLTHNFPSELPRLQPLGGVGPAGCACVSALPQSAGAGVQTAHWRAGGLAGSSPDPSPPLRHRQHQHHWVPGAVRTLVHADSWHGESVWTVGFLFAVLVLVCLYCMLVCLFLYLFMYCTRSHPPADSC